MTATTIYLPDIGDFMNVPVVEILAKPGDRIRRDEPILTLESDKATLEVPAPMSGTVGKWLVEVGSVISAGAPILHLLAEPADIDAPSAAAASDAARGHAAAPAPEISAGPQREVLQPAQAAAPRGGTRSEIYAGPSVRALARELGVDLQAIAPTGPRGRLLKEDVRNHVRTRMEGAEAPYTDGTARQVAASDFAKFGDVERFPLSRLQQLSGVNISRAWQSIPHVTNFDAADVTELEAFRSRTNEERKEDGTKLTMAAFLVKASAIALRSHPRINSSLEGDELVLKRYINIGFAADTPRGLLVPVIREADRKGLLEIAAEMSGLAEKARAGKLAPGDMQGGTFSVSSLGGIGGDGFTPLINAPEVAILGAARSRIEAVWDGAAFQPRLIMPLNLSWDHRVIDGVAAARFLSDISRLLSDLRRAVL